MNRKTIITLLIAAVAVVGGFFLYNDYTFRQEHGRVTAVDLFSYEQEVENVQDAKPVLIYFYKQEKNAPLDEDQMRVVEKFAWRHARDAKVVAINVAHLENLPLALAHGGVRTPSFVFVLNGKQVKGPSGSPADYAELQRLYSLVQSQR
ncbi:MAG: hypothetical protein K2Y39_07110 [Candidatus Obscuribacterales bacterium]|nr:hypothetical protein [Candidatus Obscuribacterales bacterium]